MGADGPLENEHSEKRKMQDRGQPPFGPCGGQYMTLLVYPGAVAPRRECMGVLMKKQIVQFARSYGRMQRSSHDRMKRNKRIKGDMVMRKNNGKKRGTGV